MQDPQQHSLALFRAYPGLAETLGWVPLANLPTPVEPMRKLAEELDEGVIDAVLADAGWKYVSADFWEASDEAPEESMERTVWW